MDLAAARTFFLWCSILNGGLLVFSALLCLFAGDWIYRMHGKWFAIPRDAFNVVLYAFLGLMKIFVLVFNLVPLIALWIVG